MKNSFLKKMMPLAVFVLGIAGAFGTMSMQHAEAVVAPVTGWHINTSTGIPCSLQKTCSNVVSTEFCRISYDIPNSPMVYNKPASACGTALYRQLP